MLYIVLAFVLLIVLIKSADYFVEQSIAFAKKYKISPFLIGFTIIAFGTSLPEFVVSFYSTSIGHPDIAISNVIGSNITNLCLILGIVAIYTNYKISETDVKINIPLNLLSLMFFIINIIIFGLQLFWFNGLMCLLFFLFMIYISSKNNGKVRITSDTKFNLIILLGSLLLLLISGKLCTDNVINFAKTFGVEESILGYFFIAIGTSLPELIASLTAVRKGYTEIGIGNILGSNIFNLLFILGISAFIQNLRFDKFVPEIIVLFFITIAVLFFSFIGKRYYLSRNEGIGILLLYFLFILFQNF